MSSVYARGRKLWVRWKDAAGRWHSDPTGLPVGSEKLAQQLAEKLEREDKVAPVAPVLTFRQWYGIWQERASTRKAWPTIRSRFELWILPAIGALRLDEIRPRHLADMVTRATDAGLAPRSVHCVYASARVCFRAAVRAEHLASSPAVLGRDDLPKAADADPEWRAGAVFTRAEVESLISDERLAPHDRMMHALKALSGLRQQEVASLQWRQWDPSTEPLGRLSVFKTKTGQPRLVPIHPTLAAMLAEWKLSGWQALHGHAPLPEDPILPIVGKTAAQQENHSIVRFHRCLDRLGLRQRRAHDLRRTFISLARADGARKDVLEAVTHGARGNIVDIYTEWPWRTLCEAVSCLQVTRKATVRVVQMPLRAAAGGGGLATFLATVETGSAQGAVTEPISINALHGLGDTRTCTTEHRHTRTASGGGEDSSPESDPVCNGREWPDCSKCSKVRDLEREVARLRGLLGI